MLKGILTGSGQEAVFFLDNTQEAPKKKEWTSTLFFGLGALDPPPPIPITQCPPPDKKGTNLLLFQIGIHPHTHQDLKLKCCRVMGQKTRYRRPCTHDLLGTHNWLAQSHIASVFSDFHWIFHTGTILLGNLLLHRLNSPRGLHPSTCASDFWTCPQTPT